MASRRIQCVRACLVAMAVGSAPLSARQLPAALSAMAGPADRAASYTATSDRYEAPGRISIELTVLSKSDGTARATAIAGAAKRSLKLFDDWLGPLAIEQLTIVDAPWNSAMVAASPPGIAVVRSRWMTLERDRALDRQVIASMARQYWLARPRPDSFIDGLMLYTGGRAIDTLLEGSQFYAERHLGGFVPYALRPMALSPVPADARPRLRRYAELQPPDRAAERIARALDVSERYLGWPAVQQAVHTFRARALSSAAEFAAVLSEQRGSDVSWLFEDTVQADRAFDYAIGTLENTAADGQFDVRVLIERRGAATFGRPLPIEIRFADGTRLRDLWDPVSPQSSLHYVGASPAMSAAIDPDVILILDEQRSNNVIRHEASPPNYLGLKLALDWAIWLQHAVLTYSGIV